jgi:GNAT superfamily N-acetyltransferase
MRPGGPDDIAAVLALGDDAVAWMNARGNTQQWGTAPWTGSRAREAVVRDQAHGGGMRIAEDQDGTVPGTTVPGTTVLGALVITEIPAAYVPAVAERELYVNLLLVSRRHSGQGVGAALIGHAKQEAAARGIGLIRVDCWAGEDGSLVRVYERYGFSRVQEFTVALPAGAWPGMLLAMRLADEEVAPGPSMSVTETFRPARGRTERKQP